MRPVIGHIWVSPQNIFGNRIFYSEGVSFNLWIFGHWFEATHLEVLGISMGTRNIEQEGSRRENLELRTVYIIPSKALQISPCIFTSSETLIKFVTFECKQFSVLIQENLKNYQVSVSIKCIFLNETELYGRFASRFKTYFRPLHTSSPETYFSLWKGM